MISISKEFKKIKLTDIDSLFIGLSVLTIFCLISEFFFIFIHSLVNIFAGGRNEIKTFLFLAYAILLTLLTKIKFKKQIIKLKDKLIFIIPVIAGFLINVLSYIIFVKQNGLSLISWHVVFSGMEESSTSLLHNHVLKGGIGYIFQLLGINYFENMDAGTVFINTMPKLIFIGEIILVSFLIFWAISFFIKKIQTVNDKIKPLFIIFYAIITFSIIKNIVDGGLFNNETFVSLAFLIGLLFNKKRWVKYLKIFVLIAYPLAILVFYLLGFFNVAGNTTGVLVNNLIIFVVYASFLFTFEYYFTKPLNRQGILLLILTSLMVFFVAYNDLTIIGYRLTTITDNDPAIVGVYRDITDPEYTKVSTIGRLKFYQISPGKEINVNEILKKYDLKDNFFPLSFPYRNCFPNGPRNTFIYEITVKKPIDPDQWQNNDVIIKSELINSVGDNYRYNITMYVSPCLPRVINIIEQVWQSRGFDLFIISNINEAGYGHF
jgi:hypothetical protein